MLYYKLIEPSEIIIGGRYRQQPIKLKRAIIEKRQKFATLHESIIFHHDNGRPHIEKPVENCLVNRCWEVLPHPPYNPNFDDGYEKLAWMESKNCQKDEKMLWSQMGKALNMFSLNKRSQ